MLTKEEVKSVLGHIKDTPWLMALLLYGAGLRVMECCRLRVKDIDFARNQVVVRAGKGDKDRYTMLPAAVKQPLWMHLQAVKRQHENDLRRGLGRVALPNALERKYPNASKEWAWQWVFPATSHYIDRVTGEKRRHHLHESVMQRAVKQAVVKAGISKPASCHTFRHSFATHLLEDGYDIRDSTGAAWAQGRQHHDDLHPCPQSRRKRREEPGRRTGTDSGAHSLNMLTSAAVFAQDGFHRL